MPYSFPSLITCMSIWLYAVLCYNVIRARKDYDIPAPSMTGNQAFERIVRVQQNTLEQLMLFLPALWISAYFTWSALSGLIGMVWVAGRVLYAYDYYKDGSRRKYGFHISAAASLLLLALGSLGVLVKLFS